MVAEIFLITAYTIGACGGAPGPLTKSGTIPRPGLTVAADPAHLKMGTWVHIEGLGTRRVEDIGSKIKGRHLDLYVATCYEALKWGKKKKLVTIIRAGD